MVNDKMVNDKMVNFIMEKKVYNTPHCEVEEVQLGSALLVASYDPNHPGAPRKLGSDIV